MKLRCMQCQLQNATVVDDKGQGRNIEVVLYNLQVIAETVTPDAPYAQGGGVTVSSAKVGLYTVGETYEMALPA